MATVIINTAVATEKTHTSTTCSCTKQKAISSRYRSSSYILNGRTCKDRSSQKREGILLELKKKIGVTFKQMQNSISKIGSVESTIMLPKTFFKIHRRDKKSKKKLNINFAASETLLFFYVSLIRPSRCLGKKHAQTLITPSS